jgi:sugar/nucleoside kinase (ribokinase family)
MILLCPIAGELEPRIINNFSGVVVVALQGWLRGFKSDGCVFPSINEDLKELFDRADTVIVSEEDINGLDIPIDWLDLCNIFIVTKATRGATVFFQNEKFDIPTLSVIECDSIGAGDVFSTAYIIRYFETKDAMVAAKFANIAAALSVRSNRFSSIPSRTEIEKFI